MKHQEFVLKIGNQKILEITDSNGNKQKITSPFSDSGSYKIYVVEYKGEVLYVGTTKTSIRNRVRAGLNPKSKNGYSGYKWKNRNQVNLHVFIFENIDKLQIEAIEAEFALLVRLETNKWPTCQNEIHFNNTFKSARLKAVRIFSKIIDRIN